MAGEIIRLGSATYLATGEDSVEGFDLAGEPASQVAEGLRTGTATVLNRLNRRRSFTITVKRLPVASPALARLAMLTHERALESAEVAGDKDITWTYQGITCVLRGCVVRHGARQSGVTSIHTYTGSFGALETTTL